MFVFINKFPFFNYFNESNQKKEIKKDLSSKDPTFELALKELKNLSTQIRDLSIQKKKSNTETLSGKVCSFQKYIII